MHIITRELPQDIDRIEIHPLADLHIGDSLCDYKLIQRELAYIRDTPNCYCLLDGDLMDTAIKSSVGDTYGAGLQPMEQLKHCVAIFSPIADKILAVLRNAFYRPLATLGKVAKVEHLFVNTASWLDYGGYGDKQGYKPASNINPVIWLDGRRKHAYAVI